MKNLKKTYKDEKSKIHKERCKELKLIRAKIAEELGIDLHQRKCTFEGYCSGTCPKCKSEELILNSALLKKQLEESGVKGRVAVAGFTAVAALSLSGCTNNNPEKPDTPDKPSEEVLGGQVDYIGDFDTETEEPTTEPDDYEGEIEAPDSEDEVIIDPYMLEGDVQRITEDDD